MKRITLIATLFSALTATAQTDLQGMQSSEFLPEANPDHQFDYQQTGPQKFESFEAAAAWADVVAIAQLNNIDYKKTRDLNAKGQGFLTVRVPYKGVRKNELLIVNAKGFEDHICYYPDKAGVEGQKHSAKTLWQN